MNRTEQKERLNDILLSIQDLKEELKGKTEDVEAAYAKIDELNDILTDIGEVDSWDYDELRNDVLRAAVEDSMQSIYDELNDFQSDLEAYMDDISESRRDALEDKYADLEEALGKFEYSQHEYDDIENALEHIEEAEIWLKEMKK